MLRSVADAYDIGERTVTNAPCISSALLMWVSTLPFSPGTVFTFLFSNETSNHARLLLPKPAPLVVFITLDGLSETTNPSLL